MNTSGSSAMPMAGRVGLSESIARSLRGVTWPRAGFVLLIPAWVLLPQFVYVVLEGGVTGATMLTQLRWYGTLLAGCLPILLAIVGIERWVALPSRRGILVLVAATAAGAAVGVALMYFANPFGLPEDGLPRVLRNWPGFTLTGVIAGAGLIYLMRADEARTAMHQDALDRIRIEREWTEVRLQVLQAQIEPHFLFNTLANVRRLYEVDPPAARAMLQHLSRYLGAALPSIRESRSTLARELELAVAYLSVQQVRMGPRLTSSVDVPATLLARRFPPMVLVTLVENAIRHGLGPLPEGGRIAIAARVDAGRLSVEVADTGAGLTASCGTGVGLANIRARLRSAYGSGAFVRLVQNRSGGVTAIVSLPDDDGGPGGGAD